MRRFQPGRLGRAVVLGIGLVLLVSGLQLDAPVRAQNSGQEEEETGPPDLAIADVQLLVDGSRTFYLEETGPSVRIEATLRNNGTGPAEEFDVEIRYRREDETAFRSTDLCLFTRSSSQCDNLSLAAGATDTAIGILNTGDLDPGRYIIRVAIDPEHSATTPDDDVRETLLLTGITTPEYHPTSVSFSPPSPIQAGTPLTVRVEIENTGRPEAPELEVVFEHCVRSPVCVSYTSRGFPNNGVKRLDRDETRALEQGRPLSVSTRLDTSDLKVGNYLFRVAVRPAGDAPELDSNNNQMTTRFTISGADSGPPSRDGPIPQCQLTGDVITLGKGVGTLRTDGRSRSVEVIYVGTRSEDGQVSLHALTKESFESPAEDGTCRELSGSPLPLQSDIASFILDQDLKLLFIGLTNGQLVVVDVDRADTLSTVSRLVSSSSLDTLDTRLTGTSSGQLFVGVQARRLYRLNVTKDPQGNIVFANQERCASANAPINGVRLFQGNIYMAAGNTLMRMDESRCNGSTTTMFTASTEIRDFAIGQLTFGITRSPRLLVGTAAGQLHVLNVFGQELADSPIDFTGSVTSLTVDDGDRAASSQGETAFVGTGTGAVHAVDLRGLFSRCSFQTANQAVINTIAVDDGGGGLPDRGFVFIGSADSQLYVMDANCSQLQDPMPTAGPIEARPLLDAEQGIFGPTGLKAIFGGGDGLFELTISL